MAALGQGVDALSIAAPVLKSGPSAYETTIARMGIEGDQAKLAAAKDAAAREAAVKQKDATLKAATLDPGTVFAPHSMMYLQKRKDAQDWLQGYMEKSGGEMPGIDAPEYGQWEAIKAGLKQFESSSKQAEADYNVMAKLIAEDAKSGNPRFRKDAPSKLNEIYSNPDLPDKGLLPERITGLYDLEGQIATTFGKIAKEQEAWASQDGTRSGTKEYIPSDAFLTVAETFATDPYAAAELQERFKSYTPEKQQWIMDYAEKLGTNSDVAMTVDMATGLYDRVRKTAQSEQLNEGGAGRADEEKVASEFVRAVENVTKGTHQGFSNLYEAFPGIPKEKVGSFVRNNPVITSLFDYDAATGEHSLKPGYEIVKDFNRLTVDVKPEAGVGNYKTPELPIKVQGAIRAANGNVTILTATDDDFKAGKVKASPPIPKEDIFQKVVYPSLWNGGDYNPVSAAGMQRAMEKMGYDVKTETMNQWNKKFVYKDPDAKTPTTAPQPKAETPAEAWARKQKEAAAAKAGK